MAPTKKETKTYFAFELDHKKLSCFGFCNSDARTLSSRVPHFSHLYKFYTHYTVVYYPQRYFLLISLARVSSHIIIINMRKIKSHIHIAHYYYIWRRHTTSRTHIHAYAAHHHLRTSIRSSEIVTKSDEEANIKRWIHDKLYIFFITVRTTAALHNIERNSSIEFIIICIFCVCDFFFVCSTKLLVFMRHVSHLILILNFIVSFIWCVSFSLSLSLTRSLSLCV